MKKSYWKQEITIPEFAPLNENITCEICIIGGGLNGIALAYLLQDHKDVVLVDQSVFVNGSTSLNTGKLTSQHDDCYHKIKTKYGLKTAKAYYMQNQDALELVQSWHQNMDFDLQSCDSTLFSKTNLSTLQKEYQTYLELDIPCTFDKKEKTAVLSMKHQYLFHPVQLAKALLQQLTIRCYNHTKITGYTKNENVILQTEQSYTITAQKAIFCTHSTTMYPSLLLFSRYVGNTSYILMKPYPWKKPMSMISIDTPALSLRSILENGKKYLLVCNQDHRVGIIEPNAYTLLDKQSSSLSTMVHQKWLNYDYRTFDHLPFIGSVEKDIYITFGYHMWGNSWSIASSMLLKDYLLNGNQKALFPYRPQRIKDMLSFTYVKENLHTGWNWIWFYFQYCLKKENGTTLTFQKKTYGYYQKDQHTYIVNIHCPHMLCILQFNPLNQTWDCPCHASSFTYDGKRICGPTTKSLHTICIKQ